METQLISTTVRLEACEAGKSSVNQAKRKTVKNVGEQSIDTRVNAPAVTR